MPINTALMAEETKSTANRMNLPTAKARGTDFATTGGPGTSSSKSTTTSTWKPSGPAPAAPVVPEFQAPEYDEGEVAKLRQRVGGSQIRSLRDVTMAALSSNTSDNPNVRKMTVRQALQGYGSGLGSILSSAQNAAVSQYQSRYNQQFNAAQLTYNARRTADQQVYNNLWGLFLRSGTQTQTSSSQSTNPGSNGGQGITSGPSVLTPSERINNPLTGIQKAKADYAVNPAPTVDVRNRSGENWDPFPNLNV